MKNSKKTDINFIVSQKLGAKQNQSFSFELILVMAVVVIIVLMGYLYFDAWWSNNSIENEIRKIYGADMKEEITAGDTGLIAITVNESGYQHLVNLKAQRDELKLQLEELKSANDAALAEIELQAEHLVILYTEASASNVTLQSLSLNGNTLTISGVTNLDQNLFNFIRSLESGVPGSTGLVNSEWMTYIPQSFSSPIKEWTIAVTLLSPAMTDHAAISVANIKAEAADIATDIRSITRVSTGSMNLAGIMQRLESDYGREIAVTGANIGKLLGEHSIYTLTFTRGTEGKYSSIRIESADTGANGADAVNVDVGVAVTDEVLAEYAAAEKAEIKVQLQAIAGSGTTSESGIKQALSAKHYVIDGNSVHGSYGDYTLVYLVATADAAGTVTIDGESVEITGPITDAAAYVRAEAEEIAEALAAIAYDKLYEQADIIKALDDNYFYVITDTTGAVSTVKGSYSDYKLTYGEATDKDAGTVTVESVAAGADGDNAIRVEIRKKLTLSELAAIVRAEAEAIALSLKAAGQAAIDEGETFGQAEAEALLADEGYVADSTTDGAYVGLCGYSSYKVTVSESDTAITVRVESTARGATGYDAIVATVVK